MASSFQGLFENAGILFPAVESRTADYSKIYDENCHRIYSLSFWMTDNELVAEQLSTAVFLRVFSSTTEPRTEHIDRALITELREMMPLGTLKLNRSVSQETKSVYGNIKRVHLERAVVNTPATERLIFLLHDVDGYEHESIARLLGISEDESRFGLHQARVYIREMVSQM